MLLKVYNNELSYNDLREVMQVLREGGVIVYPTDSVYAFGCDASNKGAVERICKLRGKDMKHPELSIVCGSISQAKQFTHFSDDTFKLMRQCLPGAFTFILQGNNKLPKLFKHRKTVGVRIPDHDVVRQLLEEYGEPLMTASLRIDSVEDIEYMTDPELIYEKYADEVDIVIDAGIGGTEASTIVDCSGENENGDAVIVRQGVGEIG